MNLAPASELLMEPRIAFLAWEATCERLRNAFSRAPGVPQLSPEELARTIAQASRLLEVLERSYGLGETMAGDRAEA